MRATEFLTEGVNDPAIFKIVFVLGGPGSGKSYISNQLGLNAMGLVTVNSDVAFVYMMQKHQLSQKMPPEEAEKRDIVRSRAKMITNKKMHLALDGRLGIHIDTTGNNYSKIANLKNNFEHLGYECFLIVINTNLETALKRNRARDRSVPEEVVVDSWNNVQSNIGNFSQIFDNFAIIDNNGNSENTDAQVNKLFAKLMLFINSAPKSNVARRWIQKQRSPVTEKWSQKYKRSIDCDNPKGFSQRAHCQGRKKNEDTILERKRKRSRKRAAYSGYGYYPGYVGDSGSDGGGGE
jgi:dephospho-CoA kinase